MRLATLSRTDLAFIRQHRGDRNRHGIAVLLNHPRHPAACLPRARRPTHRCWVSWQRSCDDSAGLFTVRGTEETRRKHLQELLLRLGVRQFGRVVCRDLTTQRAQWPWDLVYCGAGSNRRAPP